jgi:ParB family chromosome partitioning protein
MPTPAPFGFRPDVCAESTNTKPKTHERGKDHAEHAKCCQQPRIPQRSHYRACGVRNQSPKRFDAKSLEELAASFKTQGILAPLLVRELEESKYEVVAGARRLRAAKLAELEKLPVRVVKLTDAEAIEAQCVENLQREDIHPLEEALGFKSLLELGEPVYTIGTIASRAGKSEAYIYGRVRLADLIPPVAEAFLKDQITIGHALLIAKLPASQQQEAFSAPFRGLWTSEGNSQVLIPVRELAAWTESNIWLQLASAPFDKQDETLVPEAGSCVNCPKRTGFNKLLLPDVRKDSCTSPDCFRAKIDASVKKTLETKPQLIQISAAWNSREGAPLGRDQYVELEIKKTKPNGASAKLSAVQKPCDKMAEAIVMDGGKRGQVVKVCADLACRTHHPNTPSPQQVERERAEERKRIEKEKLAITTRHRILATILQRMSAPLKKADLLAVAHYLICHLSYSQVPALAKRHKVEAKKDSASAHDACQASGHLRRVGTLQAASGSQPVGFGVSAIHRRPPGRSHGRCQTLPCRC